MAGACPAGWHAKETKTGGSAEGWVECCRDAGEFMALPPQPHEKFPICNPKTREEWLAVGIDFEEGCDLRYSTCAIKYEPEDSEPAQAAAAEPPKTPPAPKSRKAPKALPQAKLIADKGDQAVPPGESVTALVEGLKDATAEGRERSALGLASLGPKAASAGAALAPLLKTDPSPRVRACAAVALASVARTGEEAVPYLRAAASDPDPKVRAVGAQALKALSKGR